MSGHEDLFVPEDPGLYGPDPSQQARRHGQLSASLGLSAAQAWFILAVSLLMFAFVGGPFWSAARQAFPLRLFSSYLVIPLLVAGLLRWNHTFSWRIMVFSSAVLGGVKLVVTVAIDIGQGMLRHWPP